jgi:hypothetical protein
MSASSCASLPYGGSWAEASASVSGSEASMLSMSTGDGLRVSSCVSKTLIGSPWMREEMRVRGVQS